MAELPIDEYTDMEQNPSNKGGVWVEEVFVKIERLTLKSFASIRKKLSKRLRKTFWCPIEVFVFHAVSDCYDERTHKRVDWTSTEDFKHCILSLKSQYEFIPITEAFRKLNSDSLRRKKYAVLTCDDGHRSVLSILPFLEEERVPVTLFINPQYLDGISARKGYAVSPQYILYDQLWSLNSPLITIGMHGYGHDDATKQTVQEFEGSVGKCIEILSRHPRYIPYFAYTWGRYSNATQQVLDKSHLVPVFADGESNYSYHSGIGRKSIDSYYLRRQK